MNGARLWGRERVRALAKALVGALLVCVLAFGGVVLMFVVAPWEVDSPTDVWHNTLATFATVGLALVVPLSFGAVLGALLWFRRRRALPLRYMWALPLAGMAAAFLFGAATGGRRTLFYLTLAIGTAGSVVGCSVPLAIWQRRSRYLVAGAVLAILVGALALGVAAVADVLDGLALVPMFLCAATCLWGVDTVLSKLRSSADTAQEPTRVRFRDVAASLGVLACFSAVLFAAGLGFSYRVALFNRRTYEIAVAVKEDDVQAVERLLETDRRLAVVEDRATGGWHEPTYWTPILLARSQEMVRLLLAYGADVGPQGEWDLTPMHTAPDAETIELLIANGVDMDARDKAGHTPLHWAVTRQRTDVAQALLAYGADVNARDSQGNPVLYWPVAYGWMDLLTLLLDHGADMNARNERGLSMLALAEEAGQEQVVQLLRQRGARE